MFTVCIILYWKNPVFHYLVKNNKTKLERFIINLVLIIPLLNDWPKIYKNWPKIYSVHFSQASPDPKSSPIWLRYLFLFQEKWEIFLSKIKVLKQKVLRFRFGLCFRRIPSPVAVAIAFGNLYLPFTVFLLCKMGLPSPPLFLPDCLPALLPAPVPGTPCVPLCP